MPEDSAGQQGDAPISEEQVRQALSELDDIQTSSEAFGQDYSSSAGAGIEPMVIIILGVLLLAAAAVVIVVAWKTFQKKTGKQG